MTNEEKREYARSKQREQMDQAVEALRSSEGWNRWIKVRSAFRTYSINNQLLISMQRPDAQLVMGFRQWRERFNRQVQKGSKAIWILAPMTKKTGELADNGEEKRKLFFRSVKVFDIADTKHIEGAEVIPISPPETEPITGDSHDWAIPKLLEFATENGCVTKFIATPGAEGCFIKDPKTIQIDPDLEPNRTVRVLVHEISHMLGVSYTDYTRPVAETICDTVAYCVCDSIGLDVSGMSVPYVAMSDADSSESLKQYAAVIHRNACLIEDAISTSPSSERESQKEPSAA